MKQQSDQPRTPVALKTHTETPDGQQIDQQPEPRPSAWLRLRWFGERYMLAHLSAYPVGVVSAMASIPLALDRMIEEGDARSGDTALLIAFGAGLAYAAQVVTVP